MLKLIIVDDEKLIREGLVNYIDWRSLGVEVCATCATALEALERIRQISPDIVISDIRMPEMNGIEMLKAIKDLGLGSEVIFISAYRDFDYAKEAIRYGAFEYLLKPIEEQVLSDTVARCVAHINDNISKNAGSELLFENKRRDAIAYFMSGIGSPEQWTAVAAEIGIRQEDGASIALIRFDNSGIDLSPQEALNLWPKPGSDGSRAVAAISVGSRVLAVYSSGRISQELAGELSSIFSSAIIGFASSCTETNPEKLSSMASWALFGAALGFCARVCGYEAFREFTDRFTKKRPMASQFTSVLRTGDGTEAEKFLREFFLSLASGNMVYDAGMVKLEVYKLLDEIIQPFTDYPVGPAIEAVAGTAAQRKSLSSCQSVLAVYESARNLLSEVILQLSEKQTGSANRLINAAIGMIQKNLSADITLENVARQLFVNPNYLSRVFSSEMSMSFSQYRAKQRIERAKELLLHSNHKVYEIASMVGYNDVIHFTKVFSAQEGVSPSEFREGKPAAGREVTKTQ